MNYIVLIKICVFLMLGIAAFLLFSFISEHKVISSAADNVLVRAKEQEADRQNELQKLLLIEGRQEKLNPLYRLDLLVLQSNIRKIIPFANTEILIVLVIAVASVGFAVVTSVFHTWVFGVFGFIAVVFVSYAILYLMAQVNYRKTEESLMMFINLLENYSMTEDELIAIFSRIQPYLTEPIKSAVEQCCIEAEITGNKGRAIRNLEKRIEHEKFKELIRNLDICSRYEANYAEVIKDSRSLLREYLAAAKERKAILNNARIELAMIIGCSTVVLGMMGDFSEQGIITVLLGSTIGSVIFAYCIVVVFVAVWSVAFEKH